MSHSQYIQMNDEDYSKSALLLFAVKVKLFYSTFPCTPATFKKLVENMPDINYVFPANDCLKEFEQGFLVGNTLLHLLQKISLESLYFFDVLLDQDADFTIKNCKGNTVIHEVIEKDLKENFIEIAVDDKKRLLHAGSVLSAHVRRANTSNPCNKNGLTHFHVACMVNHVPAAEFFLKHGVSINETVNEDSLKLPGFTALHFATNYCALDTVKVLLKHNVDVNAKDAQGMSPLYNLIKGKLRMCVVLKEFKKTNSKRCLNNLKICCKTIDQMILLITNNATANPMESLHALCTMQDTSVIKQFFESQGTNQLNCQVNSDMLLWPGYSALHFAAHFSVDVVQLLVEKGSQLGLKDAKGVTPFDICVQRFKPQEILSILKCHPNWLAIKTNLSTFIVGTNFPNNSSNVIIHMNSPICAGYTLLHLAVALTRNPKDYWNHEDHYFIPSPNYESKESKKYREGVKSCLKFNPDVTAKNSSGSTPLHLAFQLQESHVVHLLLENHTKVVNPIDVNNLSHLHIACAAKDGAVVEKLLLVEKDINRAVTSKYTWFDVKFEPPSYGKRNPPFYIPKGSTALHFAAIVRCTQAVKLLIDHGADVLAEDCDGFNPLKRLLKRRFLRTGISREDDIAVIGLLIKRHAEVIAKTTNGLNEILCYYSRLEDKRIEAFDRVLSFDHAVQTQIFECVGITPLHLACQAKNVDRVRQLLENKADVNAQVSFNSPLWPGLTPLHVSIIKLDWLMEDTNDEPIVRLLLDHGADVTIACATPRTPLHIAASRYLNRNDPSRADLRFVDLLLSHHKDFTLNPVSIDGLSHFHVACFANEREFVEKFIHFGVDVNQATDFFFDEYGGYSPLHFAARFLRTEVVDLLLAHGADTRWKAIGEDNALHSVVPVIRTSAKDTIASLLRVGVDVNAKNLWGETPLEKLLKYVRVGKEEVGLYLKQNCRVNYYNPVKEESLLAVALKRDTEGVDIFDDVIKASDIIDINEDGRNAIHNVVSHAAPRWDSFEEIDAIDATLIPAGNYMTIIAKFETLGLSIDHEEQKGSTPLHIAAQMHNVNGIIGLLNNGADINLIDSQYKTAYEYSLELAKQEPEDDFYIIRQDFDLRTLKVFIKHIYKLRFLDIAVSELNKYIDAEARTLVHVRFNSILEVCRAELNESKNQQIGLSPVTLYDFMSETGAVSAYPCMFEPNRQNINAFFKDNVDILHDKFPELAGLAILQYRKAVARVGLVKVAIDSVRSLVQFDIPHLCTDNILKFLTNEDLKNVIASAI